MIFSTVNKDEDEYGDLPKDNNGAQSASSYKQIYVSDDEMP